MKKIQPKFKVGDYIDFKWITKNENKVFEKNISGNISNIKKNKNEFIYTVNGYEVNECVLQDLNTIKI